MTFSKVLIANRGEIACRIMRTCRDMGLQTVAVFSEADKFTAHVREADEAICIGAAPSAESYLRIDRILEAAKLTGAEAIHPGYGFLSEKESFAAACRDAGIVFIGPTPEAIAAMGSKIAAKRLMASRGVPVVPGYDGADGDDDASFIRAAAGIGFPLLVKASAGGGGKGMRIVSKIEELESALASARREASSAFGDASLLIERYIENPRHIEVQIFGDRDGRVVHLFERECSIQRRHQKVLEEAPSPVIDKALRDELGRAAVKAGEAIGYRSAGTVEFVFDDRSRSFYFLEVNTRLQVEHPVTECVTGLDLVRLQIETAMGLPCALTQAELDLRGPVGHAIEARLYAEDADHEFLPQTGRLVDFHVPVAPEAPGLRLDTGVAAGDEVGIHYDPMLAKVIAYGRDRAEANRRLQRALEKASVVGVTTNLAFLRRVLAHPKWQAGQISTHFIADERTSLIGVTPDPEVLRLALRLATVFDAVTAESTQKTLPLLRPSWRNNRFADEVAHFRGEGSDWRCHYRALAHRRYLTRVDGVEALVEVLGQGEVSDAVTVIRVAVGERDSRIFEARIAVSDDRVSVHLLGVDVSFGRVARFAHAESESDAGSCRAPMPGKVLAVRIEAGQTVTAGQPLVILEAMKMEHTIEAPRDGLVGEVLVAQGDTVRAEQDLVILS
jgi:acetyl-CoA carboxylase biotin carboxylase subunit